MNGELFDCIEVNLAFAADRFHGEGTHLRLGHRLSFRPVLGSDGLPTVEPEVDGQIAAACTTLGLSPRGTDLRYVLADAFDLPWCPYFTRKHITHSFLLEPDGSVTDAYHNDTPWGQARLVTGRPANERPGDDLLSDARVLWLSPAELGPAPEPVVDVDAEEVSRYVKAYATHPDRVAALDRLTLETWLLARQRRLHAAHRCVDADDHLRRWASVVEHTYLAYRRVARGRAEPPELFARLEEALLTDAAVFDDVRQAVRATVASVLRVDVVTDELTAIPGFGSLRMVEIVELLEERFAVEFDAAQLVPERLHRLDDLCGLVSRALAAR
ncbi:acyl carrier protein [Lentzea aerocolonigenes]|uniref:acyl carrier protein n=1 Tax=Lentzea aerocolonigenes TaxID=68170 RepID=UPI0004C45DFE|nr:acyl carrier protein [Lentzea aerocolonigenes]MCP2243428.1 Acyl carrier protein [Lentzea aerocolonigenes]